jgi:sulfoxide reductase heme-binding subunit YedZ
VTRAQAVRRLGKPLVFAAGLLPLARIVYQLFSGGLGAEPIREIQLRTGWWALALLTLTLAVTPLRSLTGWDDLTRFRRMLGLFAFFYGVLHLTNYVVVDQFFAWNAIVEDIVKRPWITVGFAALVLLTPLAVTSTRGMIRRLGKRWSVLHRLVYVAAALGVIHFLWLVKLETGEPTRFGLLVAGLLALRLRPIRLPRRARAPRRVSSRPDESPEPVAGPV